LLTTINGWVSLLLLALVGRLFQCDQLVLALWRNSLKRPGRHAGDGVGEVVDTDPHNIKTVQLFAHSSHEESAALGEMETFPQNKRALLGFGGSCSVRLDGVGGFWAKAADRADVALFWQGGNASAGDIAPAGAIAIRIAQMPMGPALR